METLDFTAMRTALATTSEISDFEKELIQSCVRKEMTKDVNQTELLRFHGILKEKIDVKKSSDPHSFRGERKEFIVKIKKGEFSERLDKLSTYGRKKETRFDVFSPLPEPSFKEVVDKFSKSENRSKLFGVGGYLNEEGLSKIMEDYNNGKPIVDTKKPINTRVDKDPKSSINPKPIRKNKTKKKK